MNTDSEVPRSSRAARRRRLAVGGFSVSALVYLMAAGAFYVSGFGACEDPGIGSRDAYCEAVSDGGYWLLAIAPAAPPALGAVVAVRRRSDAVFIVGCAVGFLAALIVPFGVAPQL